MNILSIFKRKPKPKKNLDRRGYSRNGGYRMENERLCSRCPAPPADADPKCPECGGYGEVSKSC